MNTETSMREWEKVPLKKRYLDWIIMLFFLVNFFFITYIVDIEQLTIQNPDSFTYPGWPPNFFVDIIHNYGRNVDPLQYARPGWWKATIWVDVIYFGPYYAVAIYAFFKGKNWIRIPSFIWSGIMFVNVTVIMSEEIWGPHAAPKLWIVALLNLPWWTFPFIVTARLWRKNPFSKPVSKTREELRSLELRDKEVLPLKKRPYDFFFIGWFIINLLLVVYVIDIEQLVIKDPSNFAQPFWPPAFVVNGLHWWGSSFDPLLMARPVWYTTLVWIDVIAFGPFYAIATYAFIKGKNWIKIPSILYSAVICANMNIIFYGAFSGDYPKPVTGIYLAAYLPYLIIPIILAIRMIIKPHPFLKKEK